MATPSMIPDVAVLRYPLEDVQTMVFELSLIRTAFRRGFFIFSAWTGDYRSMYIKEKDAQKTKDIAMLEPT